MGSVLVDGVDLRAVRFSSLRSRVVLVPQEGFLFDSTLLDNIRSGQARRLARVYLADPDLLVLDEATSAVDPATEVRVQRVLGRPAARGLRTSTGLDDRDAQQHGSQRARQAYSCPDPFERRALDERVQRGTDARQCDEQQLDRQSGLEGLARLARLTDVGEHPAAGQNEHDERGPGYPGVGAGRGGESSRIGSAERPRQRRKDNLTAHPGGRCEHVKGQSDHVEVDCQHPSIQHWWTCGIRPGGSPGRMS